MIVTFIKALKSRLTIMALCVGLFVLSLVWFSGRPAHTQDSWKIKVTVRQENSNGKVAYHYSVINKSQQPIVALQIGCGREGVPQLPVPPLGWSIKAGIPQGSAASPSDWEVDVITTEESELFNLEWRTGSSSTDILPGITLSGFSIYLPEANENYRSSYWTVILGDLTAVSAKLQSENAPMTDITPPALSSSPK